jgi:hypothetical protein
MAAVPLHFLILLAASWLGRRRGEAIAYLHAENRVLRANLTVWASTSSSSDNPTILEEMLRELDRAH